MTLSNKYTLFTFILLAFACKNESADKAIITQADSSFQNAYTIADIPISTWIPDTSIGSIKLLNVENIHSYLGEDIMDRLVENHEYPFPGTKVFTADGKQQLSIYFHYGGVRNEFSEFEIQYTTDIQKQGRKVTDTVFVTENGIQLGSSKQEVLALKGTPDSTSSNCLYYWVYNTDNSAYIDRYNQFKYYANYCFSDTLLTYFMFGFEYP